jgi:DnaJ family protein C protein 2
LIDPTKRKRFDSSLPFDDNIPAEDEVKDDNFYDILDEVFRRNARFAVKKPVPNIGDEKTPLE